MGYHYLVIGGRLPPVLSGNLEAPALVPHPPESAPMSRGLLTYFCSLLPTNMHIPFNLYPLGLKHDRNGPTQFTHMIAPVPEPRNFLSF